MLEEFGNPDYVDLVLEAGEAHQFLPDLRGFAKRLQLTQIKGVKVGLLDEPLSCNVRPF